MPIKLYYFDIKGLAELSRLILHAADVEFEDIRFSREAWPEHKPKMPLHKVPVLYDDDLELVESGAIARYLANKYNLAGKCDKEKAKVDAVITHCALFYMELARTLYYDNSEHKEANIKKLTEEGVPLFLCNMSKLMKLYGSDNHFVGNQLTAADIAFFNIVDTFSQEAKFDISKYPELVECVNKVKEVPGIKKYLSACKA